MYFSKLAFTTTLLASAFAQRPASQSICDYYTTALLKDNTPANQYTLLTLLVNTVVIGNYTQPNTGVAVPGILAPGVYNGEQVNLLPYFNGCLKSTNVNDKPASVNFLDGGGAAPLMNNMPANDMTSNQYFLLTHLYQFIGKLIGCSGYGQSGFPAYMGDPSMYRVHKFMGLDENELGYFIQQVGLAALSFGVSTADANAAGGALMTTFGYRCSPAVAITGDPALQSICIAKTCPLDPNANCGAYPWYGVGEEPMAAPQCSMSQGYSTATYTQEPAKSSGWSKSQGYEKSTYTSEPAKSSGWSKSQGYEKSTYTSEPAKSSGWSKSQSYEKSTSTPEPVKSNGWTKFTA